MKGRKFIISTRPAEKFSTFDADCCFDLVNVPLTEISEKKFTEEEIESIEDFDPDCVVFTSGKGAEIFFSEIDPHLSASPRKYYGIGPATCRKVMEQGFICQFPGVRNSEGLGKTLVSTEKNSRILLFRSSQANIALDSLLRSANIRFLNITAYNVSGCSNDDARSVLKPDCFGIIFTSSMEVESFIENLGPEIDEVMPSEVRMFTIGEPTSDALKSHGLEVAEPLGNSDFKSLFEEVCRKYCD